MVDVRHSADPSAPAASGPGAPVPAPPGRRRRWLLAGVGLTLGAAFVLAGAAAAAVLLARPHRPPPRRPHPLRDTVFTLHAGECADLGANGVSGARVIPCAQPHEAEIYGDFTVAGRRWPGQAALTSAARAGCAARLAAYLNPQMNASTLSESYVFPDRGAWTLGERKIICEVRGTSGELTGSVRAFGG